MVAIAIRDLQAAAPESIAVLLPRVLPLAYMGRHDSDKDRC